MGGMRSERRKWPDPAAAGVILYVVNLSEYDLKLREQPKINRMKESLETWQQWLQQDQEKALVVFTKKDIFMEKIKKAPHSLNLSFDDWKYDGKESSKIGERAINFIVQKFGAKRHIIVNSLLESDVHRLIHEVINLASNSKEVEDPEQENGASIANSLLYTPRRPANKLQQQQQQQSLAASQQQQKNNQNNGSNSNGNGNSNNNTSGLATMFASTSSNDNFVMPQRLRDRIKSMKEVDANGNPIGADAAKDTGASGAAKPQEKKYRTTKSLSKGGQGDIFLVQTPQQEELVMKRITFQNSNDLNEALQEVKSLYFLRSSGCNNILSIVDFYVEDAKNSNAHILCVILAYCRGGDLRNEINKRIKKKKASGEFIEETIVYNWFKQLCMGLKVIHKNSFIHRDLVCTLNSFVFLRFDFYILTLFFLFRNLKISSLKQMIAVL